MIRCSGKNITQSFTGESILTNITFEIKAGERIGIVGRNGSGKTTLLRLLASEETPTSGHIHWKKGTAIGYLAQIPHYPKEMTVREVLLTAFENLRAMEKELIELEKQMADERDEQALMKLASLYGEKQEHFSAVGGYEIESQLNKVACGLHLMALLDTAFNSISGGEKTKVCLAVLLLKKPDLLLLDEPTNHLDLEAVEWLTGFLKGVDGTVVIVSHDRYFLDDTVTKIMDLEEGELTIYHTNYSRYVKEKEKRLLDEFQKYEQQQKKIKKMKEAIKRLRDWANRANPPNEGLHKRARNMERALQRMTKIARPPIDKKKMALHLEATHRSGTDVLVMDNLSKVFNTKNVLQNIALHLRYKERIVIIGNNGAGKSTLLHIILGLLTPDRGSVKIGSGVKIGYLAQHVFHDNVLQGKSVMEVYREVVAVSEEEARHHLARFLFFGYAVYKNISQLSGGEKMRLRLAQLMYQDINLLVLDEPTNHLDIESRDVLEEVLESFDGTVLAVSHDRYFINKLFDRVCWLNKGKLHVFEGDYEWAKRKMKEMEDVKKKEILSSSTPALVSQKTRRTVGEVEVALEQVESQLYALEEEMGSADEYQALEKKREALYIELASLEEDENEAVN
ncbi:ribosomal protection-like ABC-F family protein [Salipaludibacillus agaradhaerens]|uniref:ribosomal protection-like ABC-F family protein n=1 Tax=Salipaludibacillus agaradhaerens TaxID=76935 RepID=UPI000997958E|nr:ABC-F type ribosomal protection protein [Salipaludibacillus agaradhaerens]